jgi:hypothetical protein
VLNERRRRDGPRRRLDRRKTMDVTHGRPLSLIVVKIVLLIKIRRR